MDPAAAKPDGSSTTKAPPARASEETIATPQASETVAAPAGAGPMTVATMAADSASRSDLHITMTPGGSGTRVTSYARDQAAGVEAEPPTEIAGYRRLRRLGAGGMGLVYEAEHVQLKRRVALKLLRPTVAESADFKARFMRESKAMAAVKHENVVAIYDAGEASGFLYMALEFVAGSDLSKFLKRRHRLEANEAIDIICACARGLAAIHAAGLVHRDIKPQNIFLDRDNRPKIGDLGLARAVDGEDRMTNTGTTWGTPAYMSPEQIRGVSDIDIRSDIHALGATMYTLLTGAEPYAGATSFIITHKVLTDPTPDPRVLNQLVPVKLATVVRKMMAKEREDRYQNPTDLLQDLLRAKAGDRLLHAGDARASAAAPVSPIAAAITIETGTGRTPRGTALASEGRTAAAPPARNVPLVSVSLPTLDPLVIKLIAFGVLFCGLGLVANSVIGHSEVEKTKQGPTWASDGGQEQGMPPWAVLAVGSARARLRFCPPGLFEMGSPPDEIGRDDVETRHEVTLTRGFWIGETECTQAMWAEVMGPEHHSAVTGDDYPVDSIDWHEANDFCTALTKRCPDIIARLPTEAEWEYACRADSRGAFEQKVGSIAWVGDQPDLIRAWSSPPPPPDPADGAAEPMTGNPADRAVRALVDKAQGDAPAKSVYHTHPVAMLAANAWGLHDMHGNVAEWCSDAWDRRTAYDSAPITDPTNDSGNCSIVRGGSWFQLAQASRSAARTGIPADAKTDWVGFRFVVTEAPPKAKAH